ncbi:SRPBCC domain-containing protein [Candidatus Nitronereus thalassa]|uniref:SRPBCC domain-containing protein n=1 Tax=Candidatus Nitronereus thalassa TaxID=3020898 RepID=A0ABU3K7W2_9BACT|nr:SRPBCC domain-containing protein [Candidatus Nitronereus thalassa]MDT7042480.1 SRPBCC domain-containing protein [Candidatus Nitronereus thalassa]
MANSTANSQTSIQITKIYQAPREKVFEAWTTPEALKQWFGPSDDFKTPSVEVDLRVGGKYRIQMLAPNGESHIVGGTYKEISAPGKLVFTWAWEAGGGCGDTEPGATTETLVTVEFRNRDGETEMVLTHEQFPNPESREKHNEGWGGCLDRLRTAI